MRKEHKRTGYQNMILGTPLQNELGMHFCASKGFQKAGILNICIDMWAPISIFVPVKGFKKQVY